MGINIEEHKTYIESHKMDMVPYTIAIQAIKETAEAAQIKQLDEAIATLSAELSSISPDLNNIKDTYDKNSTRES